MIDIILLVARILFIALLFVFLFAIMKAGIGLVRGQRAGAKVWTLAVEQGPRELRGVRVQVNGPVIIGRDPSADIVIPESYVSARQARFSLMGPDLFVENLSRTNGTMVNGQFVVGTAPLAHDDIVSVGNITIHVRFA